MTTRAKTMLLAFTMVSLVAAQTAEAARLGGNRGGGMRRAAPTQSYQRPSPPPQQYSQAPAQQAPAAQPQKKGVGVGTAVAAGVAGAAVGYMAGKAMNDGQPAANNGQQAAPQQGNTGENWAQPAQKPASGGMPWGLILILLGVFGAALFWFRRRVAPPVPANQPMGSTSSRFDAPVQGGFDSIPKIGSGMNNGGGYTSMANQAPTRLTDGTETPNFLRQAKATFLHLQSLNTVDSLEEIRRYMTPELFTDVSHDIGNNTDVADFPQLDCALTESVEEGSRHIASVRFSGMVSESVNAPAVPFAEVWHYVKDSGTNGKWLVAGIQQD